MSTSLSKHYQINIHVGNTYTKGRKQYNLGKKRLFPFVDLRKGVNTVCIAVLLGHLNLTGTDSNKLNSDEKQPVKAVSHRMPYVSQ